MRGDGFDSLADQLTEPQSDSHRRLCWSVVGVISETNSKQPFQGGISKSIWIDVSQALKPAATIDAMVKPYLGGDDPLFGKTISRQVAGLLRLGSLGLTSTRSQSCT